MRALVISGGGSKGAFAGGLSEYLIREKKRDYQIFVGTSTGSLLIPHLACAKIDHIKEVYTNVSQKDIYNICPFKIKKDKEGKISSRIDHFNVVKMFIRGKKTFGEHYNLRDTIRRTLSPEDFEIIKSSKKEVIVTVANLSRGTIEYKYLRDCSYEDWTEWMWISSSFVPFMSLVRKNGFDYADGGFGDYSPIEAAIDAGATEIDAIVLIPRRRKMRIVETKNAFDVLMQCMQFMLSQIASDDIHIGHLESIYNDRVKVKYYFAPRELTEHSFYFDPEQMRSWWQEGLEYGRTK